eukprot:jgi/Tetstr1/431208/TSEL_020920.t1
MSAATRLLGGGIAQQRPLSKPQTPLSVSPLYRPVIGRFHPVKAPAIDWTVMEHPGFAVDEVGGLARTYGNAQ